MILGCSEMARDDFGVRNHLGPLGAPRSHLRQSRAISESLEIIAGRWPETRTRCDTPATALLCRVRPLTKGHRRSELRSSPPLPLLSPAVRRQCVAQWCGECLLYADSGRGLTRVQCPGNLQQGNNCRGLCRTVHLGKNRWPRGGEARVDLTSRG